jgi:hypothetical protein
MRSCNMVNIMARIGNLACVVQVKSMSRWRFGCPWRKPTDGPVELAELWPSCLSHNRICLNVQKTQSIETVSDATYTWSPMEGVYTNPISNGQDTMYPCMISSTAPVRIFGVLEILLFAKGAVIWETLSSFSLVLTDGTSACHCGPRQARPVDASPKALSQWGVS